MARQEETTATPSTFIYAFGSLVVLMVAHALSETARDTLFLTGLSPESLPLAYLAIAGLTFVVMRVNSAILRHSNDKRRLLAGTMLFAAVVDVLFWLLLRGGGAPAWSFVLYVWTGLFSTVAAVQFWLLLSDSLDVAQAKRMFGRIAAGGVVGASLGSFVADRMLTFGLPPASLILAAGLVLLVGCFAPLRLARPVVAADDPREAQTTGESFREVCSHSYLRSLLMLVIASSVSLTVVDYVFKAVAHTRFEDAQSLGTFFARFYLALNLISLAVQVVLSGPLLRRFGVHRVAQLLPSLLFFLSLGFVLFPLPLLIMFSKGAGGSLKHSIHRTAMEVLNLPVPRRARERFKGVIDGVGQRGAQALASLALLGAAQTDVDVRWVLAGGTMFAAGWWAITMLLREDYLHLFRQSIVAGGDVDHVLTPLDVDSFGAVLRSLNSSADEEALVGLELFERYERVDYVPRLILYHPSPVVSGRALSMFVQLGDVQILPIVHRLLASRRTEMRAHAVTALAVLDEDEAALRSALDDPERHVRIAAMVGLEQRGHSSNARQDFGKSFEAGSRSCLVSFAQAVERSRADRLVDCVVEMLSSDDPVVVGAACRAIERVPSARAVEALIPWLKKSALREPVRAALLAIGAPALDAMERSLSDTRGTPHSVRLHVPRSIHRFESQRAMDILLAQLPLETDLRIERKILQGVGRLAADQPRLTIDHDVIRGRARAFMARALEMEVFSRRFAAERFASGTPCRVLVRDATLERSRASLERVFRCLQILQPKVEYERYWRASHSDDKGQRAAALEVLTHAVDPEFRTAVVALLEKAESLPTPLPEELSRISPEDVTQRLADQGDPLLHAIAKEHLATLGRFRRRESRT